MIESGHTIHISTATILKGILLGVLLWLLYVARDVVVIILFSIIIASAVESLVHKLARWKIPRIAVVLCIYIVALVLFILILYLVIPIFFGDIFGFFADFVEYLNDLFGPGQQIKPPFDRLPPSFVLLLKGSASSLEQYFLSISLGAFKVTGAIFGGLLSFWLVFILSFYLSMQRHGIERFLTVVAPHDYQKNVLRIWRRAQVKLGLWLQGQMLLSILVGSLVFIGLKVLGIQFALVLAVIAASLEVIPGLGPIIASIPAIFVAFIQKPSLALFVIILYIAIQQFENHIVVPLVMRKMLGVPAVIVIISLLVGASVAGLVGAILAVPVAVVAIEIIQDISDQRRLREELENHKA